MECRLIDQDARFGLWLLTLRLLNLAGRTSSAAKSPGSRRGTVDAGE